jgi:plasmid replication initiation protein
MPKLYYQQRKLPLTITKSNELVRAQLHVENNALANKIFYLLIQAIEPNQFPKVETSIKNLGKDEGGGYYYRRIKEATKILTSAKVEKAFFENNIEVGFEFENIFISAKYSNGIIKARFNSDMYPHLLELKKRFTTLNYFELMDLPSFYSQRIYEILKSWEKPEGFVELTIEVLYDMISFPKDLRNDFASVRRYALEKAEKDINARTELRYKWEPIKEGKKVVAIRFTIGEQGVISQKKRKAKEEEKEKKRKREEAALRKPHLIAGITCRREHGFKVGGICPLMKPRTKKCHLCRQVAGMKSSPEVTLFQIKI